jgi:hypothetical protein
MVVLSSIDLPRAVPSARKSKITPCCPFHIPTIGLGVVNRIVVGEFCWSCMAVTNSQAIRSSAQPINANLRNSFILQAQNQLPRNNNNSPQLSCGFGPGSPVNHNSVVVYTTNTTTALEEAMESIMLPIWLFRVNYFVGAAVSAEMR